MSRELDCPKCKTKFDYAPDDDGVIHCPNCEWKLEDRTSNIMGRYTAGNLTAEEWEKNKENIEPLEDVTVPQAIKETFKHAMWTLFGIGRKK